MIQSNKWKVQSKFKYLWGLIVLLLLVWAILFYIYRGVIVPAAGTAVTQTCIDTTGEYGYLFEVSDGKMELVQSFFVTSPELSGLGLTVQSKDGSLVEHVKAQVRLVDGMTKEPIFDDEVVVDNVVAATHLNIIFDEKIENAQDMYMEMRVIFSEECASRIQVHGTQNPQYEYLECQLNRESIPQGIGLEQYVVFGHFILNLFKIFVVALSLFVVVIYWMVFIKKSKLENIYLVSVLVLGLFYSFVLVPFSVPDESMHASSIYRITNDIMGVEETVDPNTIYKRYDDAAIALNNDANLNQYYIVYSNLTNMVEKAELIETGYRDTGVTGFMYAPAVIGLLLGRLIGMGPVMMYMFARILMLAFFALIIWWSMKKLPFGKTTLFVIGMMPVTLQQAASLSYDVVVNAVTILFISLVFYHSYMADKIRKRDMLLIAILSLWLLVAKGGAYLPLLLMLTFIPAIKLGGKNKKKIILSTFIGVLLILFLFTSFGHLGNEGETVSVVSTQYYSISELLRNPSILFNLGMGTALFNSSYYISTMIGQRLGFLNIILDDLVVYIYLFLLLLTTIKKEDDPLYITGKNKVIMGVSIIGSVALVMASMLLFVTPVGSGTIQGVQGRYFIPVLWIVLMIFRNRSIVLKKDISYGVAFVAIITHVLVFAYALKEIFML